MQEKLEMLILFKTFSDYFEIKTIKTKVSGYIFFIGVISATYSKWSQYSASGAVVNFEVFLLIHRNDVYFPGIKVSWTD